MDDLAADFIGLAGRIDPGWLPALGLAVLAHFLAEPSRWRGYLHRHPGIAWSGLLHVYSFTALAGYLLPAKLGLPMRILLLRRRFGIGFAAISALMAVDGLLYYGAWALAALIALPWAIGGGWADIRAIALVALAVSVAAGLGIVLLWKSRRMPAGLTGRIESARRHVRTALDALRGWPLYAAAAITSVDILSHVLRHGILLAMLGHQLPLPVLYAITTTSLFAGMVSLMPMGLGGYDLILVLLLQVHGIPAVDGVALALANRLAGLAMSALLGGWGGLALGLEAWNRSAWVRLAAQEAERERAEGRPR